MPSAPPSTPSHLAVTRRGSNPGPTPRPVPPGTHILWAVPLGAALLIAAAAFFGNRAMEDRILSVVKSELESRRDTCVQSLRDWVESECAKAMLVAGRKTVRDAAPRFRVT